MFGKEDIVHYFLLVKRESMLAMGLAVLLVLSAGLLFLSRSRLHRGAILPFFLTALLLAASGFSSYRESDLRRPEMVDAYESNPSRLEQEELPRMQKQLRSYLLYRYMAMVFLLIGVSVYLYYRAYPSLGFWRGLGLATALLAILLLLLGLQSERNALEYTRGLIEFSGR